MDITLTRLRHIIAIAETRSFSRAAQQLNLTQPALSRSIAAFEDSTGMRLFDRSRGGVEPTAIGRQVIAEAQDVLRAASGLDRNLRLYAQGEAGQVAVGLGPLMASLLLPSLGKTVLQTRPGLQFITRVHTPDVLLGELMTDRIELVFGTSAMIGDEAEVVLEPLGHVELCLMVRAGHPLAGRQGLTITELRRFPVASATELPAANLTGDAGAFVCENYHILRDMVLETDCIWLSTSALVRQELVQGWLTMLDSADFAPMRSDVSLITRRGRTISPAAIALANYARRTIASLNDDVSGEQKPDL